LAGLHLVGVVNSVHHRVLLSSTEAISKLDSLHVLICNPLDDAFIERLANRVAWVECVRWGDNLEFAYRVVGIEVAVLFCAS